MPPAGGAVMRVKREMFKSLRTWGLVGTALLCALTTLPALAQESGVILGVVKDSSGGAVPNAKVTVTNTDTAASRTATTADDGAYRIPALQPGHYSLKVEASGFKTETVTDLTLNVAEELISNLTVQVGAAAQEVIVTGEAPVINTTTSSLGNLINDETISDMPLNGRNYSDLTLLSPGVAQTTHNGLGDSGLWYSSNGAPPRSNNYMIDGAVTVTKNGTNPSSVTGNTLGVDGIKEYKVVTNASDASYGLLMGSQMVIVSKSGTNQWHGTGFDYLRNNHLDARNFFEAQPSFLEGQRLPQFKRNNFGASLGGPIRKDKTFFFLTYEGLRVVQGDTIQDVSLPLACHVVNNTVGGVTTPFIIGGGSIPSADLAKLQGTFPGITQTILQGPMPGNVALADVHTLGLSGGANCLGQPAGTSVASLVQPWIGQFPAPNETIPGSSNNYTFSPFTRARDDYAQFRVDHNFGANDSVFTRYTFDDAVIHTPYVGGVLSLQDSGPAFPQYTNLARSRNQYVTIGENHIFSPVLLNSFRLSFARLPYLNSFTQANTPLNPNFLLQDSTSTCNYKAGATCVWSFVPGFFTGGFNPGSGVTALTPPGTFPNYHYNNTYTLSDDIYYTHGKHAFKFGTLVTRMNQPHLQSKSIFGNITFGNITNFLAGKAQNFNVVGPGAGAGDPACDPSLPCLSLNSQYGHSGYLDRDHTWYTVGLYVQDDYRATSRLTLNLGLRYEFMTHISEMFNRQSSVTDLHSSKNPTVVPDGIWKDATYKNFSPRIGFAWDTRGNGRTAVRGGFGVYYDVGNIGALLTQNSTGVLPFVANTTFQAAGPVAVTLPLNPVALGAVPGRSLQMGDYQDKSPHSLQYNLGVEQQMPGGIGLAVFYVGRRGLHLFTGVEGNPVLPSNLVNGQLAPNTAPVYNVGVASSPGKPGSGGLGGCFNSVIPVDSNGNPTGTPAVTPCRVNPYFGSALFFTNGASSWYNGLQVNVTKKLSRGLMFQGAYTWSRSTDTTEGTRYNDDCGGPAQANFGHNPYNLAMDYGPSCFDIPNVMHLNLIYDLPSFKSKGIFSRIASGWEVTSLVSIQQGNSFVPIVNNDRSFSGIVSQNPSSLVTLNTAAVTNVINVGTPAKPQNVTYNWIPYDPNTVITGDPNHWFNPLMFGVPSLGLQGNAPRGILRDPGLGDWDFSLIKNTRVGFLGEGGNIQFRAEFFNLLNRANFSYPMATAATQFTFNTNTTTDCGTGVPGNGQAHGIAGCNLFAPNGATLANPLGNVGQITSTATTARQIQLALRFSF